MAPSAGQEGQIATGHTETSACCWTLHCMLTGHDLRVHSVGSASRWEPGCFATSGISHTFHRHTRREIQNIHLLQHASQLRSRLVAASSGALAERRCCS